VLATLYHVDTPPSNVSLSSVHAVLNTEKAKGHIANQAIIALGDSVSGARLVGVDSLPNYLKLYDATISTGTLSGQPMQATLGASVAKRLNLTIGSRFNSAHGLEAGGSTHDDAPYTVTAILQPSASVIDHLVLTPIESIWLSHEGVPRDAQEAKILEQARDVTAVLIEYRYAISALALPKLIEADAPDSMSIVPVAQQLSRLWVLFNPFFQLLLGLSALITLSSCIGVMLNARLTQPQRLRDLGVLRLLGLANQRLYTLLLLESLVLWLAACGLMCALLCVAYELVQPLNVVSWPALLSHGAPIAAWVVAMGLLLVLLNAAHTAYKLHTQSLVQVMQSR
jgi:putative ABC transport system permease protein